MRILSKATVEAATRVQVSGPDRVIGVPMSFGLGYMTPVPGTPEGSFGHAGAGGSVGAADPAGEWALGYVMNQMNLGITGDARGSGLVEAVLASIPA
jgi:CubicO group peptidase (beta-lactamase class C family)